MLSIKPEFMHKIRTASTVEEVQEMVANAVILELATLPAYLTGAFSFKAGFNNQARSLITSVAFEEMLHMTLACNLLISIGGNPTIKEDGLALQFPGPLPMSVDEGLIVSLNAATPDQIHNVFMGIERPDTTVPLPGEDEPPDAVLLKQQKGFESIGDFYQAILEKLKELLEKGSDPFTNPRLEWQIDVSEWFPPSVKDNPSGKVSNLETANAVVNTIVAQGEGSKITEAPIDPYGGLLHSFAHFFKFGEIYYGKQLEKNTQAPSGWSYDGAPIPFEPEGIYNFVSNAKLSDYHPSSAAYVNGQAFYNTYVRLLTCLDEAFNGDPSKMRSAIGLMYELKLTSIKVVQNPADPSSPYGKVAAPPFMP